MINTIPRTVTYQDERERLIQIRDSCGIIAVGSGLIGLVKPTPVILGIAAISAIISFCAELKLRKCF